MLEDSEILEVKQGPYQINNDKYSIWIKNITFLLMNL